MKPTHVAIGLFAIALTAGCGGSSKSSPTTPSPMNQGTSVTIPMNAQTLGSNAYSPNPVTVASGTTVTWVNNDTIAHTSTSDSAGVFDTGTIAAGGRASFTFQSKGTFPYHCTFHRGMVGSVVVQ
jgi:plastocyanin